MVSGCTHLYTGWTVRPWIRMFVYVNVKHMLIDLRQKQRFLLPV